MQTIKWKIEELNKKNGVKCSIQGLVFILGKNGCCQNFLHVLGPDYKPSFWILAFFIWKVFENQKEIQKKPKRSSNTFQKLFEYFLHL
jgi:hypothetical protein